MTKQRKSPTTRTSNDTEDQLRLGRKNSPTRIPNELREGEGPYLVLVLSMKDD
jgi:hypothetical protein